MASELRHIPISKIQENSEALRVEVDKESISYKELVQSIRDEGILLPILVRCEKDENGDEFYPLVDGLQRFTAASEAGLETVPAQITTMEASKVLAAQVMANATRVDTTPAQFANALKRILQLEPTLTTEDLGRRVGKSGAWVIAQLKLTKLLPHIQKLVDEGKLTTTNGIALSSLPQDKQDEYLTQAMSESPATFGPKITELVKEIKAAARQGRVVDNSFKPTMSQRKGSVTKELLTEIESGNTTTIQGLLQSNNIVDAVDAAAFMVKWFFSLDPVSVAQQKAKWEAEQEAKKQAKEEREKKRQEEKEAKARATAAAAAAA